MATPKQSALASLTPEGLNFSLDELEELEGIVEAPASQWETVSQGKMMKAMIWVLRKRSDPNATLEDAGKVRMTELEAELAPFVADVSAAT